MILIMLLCLVAEAFFSGSEIAIISVDRARTRRLVEKGSSRARAIHKILEKPEWFLGTTLFGTTLSSTTLSAYATLYVVSNFGKQYELATILLTAPLLLIFAEVLPKTFFQRYADRLAFYVVYPLRVISWVFAPFVVTLAGIARLAIRVVGIRVNKRTPFITREELELVYQASERKDGVKDLERRMIERIFTFSERDARDLMIPLAQVVSVSEEATLEDATTELRRSGFSRLPVYSGRVFQIVGWINHFDLLLAENRETRVRDIVRKARFVPATTEAVHLLAGMQRAGESLSIIVDEYGSAVGIVTLEDVIEEVVGNIEDEYDTVMPAIRRVDEHRLIVSARMPLEQLGEAIRQSLPRGDYETVGGFLLDRLQRIPKVGEEVRFRKVTFRIVDVTDRTIEQVEVSHP